MYTLLMYLTPLCVFCMSTMNFAMIDDHNHTRADACENGHAWNQMACLCENRMQFVPIYLQ
jgi:hypothetical protein